MSGELESGTLTGTYSIAASGFGFLSNPLVSGASIYGLVSQQGIFVGSSTESGYNDLFIAAPIASPAPSLTTLKGSYTIADLDVSSALEGGVAYVIGSMFQVNPDGAGNLGTFTVQRLRGWRGRQSLYADRHLHQVHSEQRGVQLHHPQLVERRL